MTNSFNLSKLSKKLQKDLRVTFWDRLFYIFIRIVYWIITPKFYDPWEFHAFYFTKGSIAYFLERETDGAKIHLKYIPSFQKFDVNFVEKLYDGDYKIKLQQESV